MIRIHARILEAKDFLPLWKVLFVSFDEALAERSGCLNSPFLCNAGSRNVVVKGNCCAMRDQVATVVVLVAFSSKKI